MRLYELERHEPLIDVQWSEELARAAIARIADDAHRSFGEATLWPIHPLDRSPERPADSLKTLYFGAAGVIWALNYLDETNAIKVKRDYLATVRKLVQRHRDDIRKYSGVREYLGGELASYLMGETGILLLHWKMAPSEDLAQQIFAAIEAKVGDPRGLIWGAPGTMLAALFMHECTGDPRWKKLFLDSFEALWNQWEYEAELRCRLWTFNLHGISEKRLGALHGFVANAFPMIRGRHLLPPNRRDESMRRISETLLATALIDRAHTNWPHSVGPTTRQTSMPLLVQHCSGAPGIITAMAEFPKDSRWPIDAWLESAGELVWDAGPTVKLPVLCHGAAGSGYAFLKTLRADRRKEVARPCAQICDACNRSVRSGGAETLSAQVFAVDRRLGLGDFSLGLHSGGWKISDHRCVLKSR